MERDGRAILADARVDPSHVQIIRSADARFVGQGHEITITVPNGPLDEATRLEIERAFHQSYGERYGRTLVEMPIEIVAWRCTVAGPSPEYASFAVSRTTSEGASEPKGHRQAYFPDADGYVRTPVYDRYGLRPGWSAEGPLIIEERESTTVVGPHAVASIDPFMNIVVKLGEAQ